MKPLLSALPVYLSKMPAYMLLKRYCWHDVKVQKGPLCSPPLVSSRREASSRNYRFRYSEPTNAFARNNKAGSPSAFAIW